MITLRTDHIQQLQEIALKHCFEIFESSGTLNSDIYDTKIKGKYGGGYGSSKVAFAIDFSKECRNNQGQSALSESSAKNKINNFLESLQENHLKTSSKDEIAVQSRQSSSMVSNDNLTAEEIIESIELIQDIVDKKIFENGHVILIKLNGKSEQIMNLTGTKPQNSSFF